MAPRSVPVLAAALLALTAPLALAAPLALPLPAAADGPVVVALPGAWLTTYATAATATTVGGDLTFLNLDLFTHNVVAFVATGANDRPWCHLFPAGQCPLFWSRIVGFGEATEVLGLDQLEAGRAYSYYCVPHPSMRGTLVALPAVPA